MPADLNNFYANVFNETNSDELQHYSDADFIKALQIDALENIKIILCSFLETLLHHEGRSTLFYLSDIINTKDNNNLNALDYCVIAGLHELAAVLAGLGGKTENDFDKFTARLKAKFANSDNIDILKKINLSVEKAHSGINLHNKSPLLKKPKRKFLQRILYKSRKFVVEHKISILFFVLGVTCVSAAPFSGGASTVLLLAVGIPALMAAINAYQNSTAASRSYKQAADQSRTTEEGRMIRMLIRLVLEELNKLEHDPAMVQNINANLNTVLNETHIEQHLQTNDTRNLLFVFNRADREELTEDVLREAIMQDLQSRVSNLSQIRRT